jgi:hypothetical protein
MIFELVAEWRRGKKNIPALPKKKSGLFFYQKKNVYFARMTRPIN